MVIEPNIETNYCYPNKMVRIVLIALEDLIGKKGVSTILNLAQLPHLVDNYPSNTLKQEFSFEEFGKIQEALDQVFGFHGSRALALHAGRETWKYALKDFVPILGIADLAVRSLPLSIKLKIGLEIFAQTFNRFTDQRVRLGEDDRGYLWIIETCPVCWQRHSSEPCCHLAIGLLQESLTWVSGGKLFHVEEVTCIACGDPSCTIVINKRPIA